MTSRSSTRLVATSSACLTAASVAESAARAPSGAAPATVAWTCSTSSGGPARPPRARSTPPPSAIPRSVGAALSRCEDALSVARPVAAPAASSCGVEASSPSRTISHAPLLNAAGASPCDDASHGDGAPHRAAGLADSSADSGLAPSESGDIGSGGFLVGIASPDSARAN